ncbi:hypothetical protein [Priestia megaterium]|uniref:hypothetical protein n=1 Tax=Priestia megaterium TaxID=1404 RepID=UPI000BFBD2D2|nr:hypothetical protein [Priestia megaterium]PGQ88173.1 hypothetical protein COA18_04415 [Priestia megaterium]
MGKTVRIAQKEKILNSEINWHITGEGCYGVEVLVQLYDLPKKSIRKWEFDSSPMDEVLSFYWYKQVLKMIDHYYKDPADANDITRIMAKTRTLDIKDMGQEAVKTCFAF